MSFIGNACGILMTSGSVSPELVPDLGTVTQAMLPVGGTALVLRASERLAGFHKHVVVSLDLRDAQCARLASSLRSTGKTVVHVDSDASLFDAFQELVLAAIGNGFDEAEIFFGDTETDTLLSGDAIAVAIPPDDDRWTRVGRNSAGRLTFVDKATITNPIVESSGLMDVVVGQFRLSNLRKFSEIIAQAQTEGRRSLWEVWSKYDADLPKKVKLVTAVGWKDFGHLDTFHQSRMHLLGARAFNTMSADPVRGLVKKQSISGDKIVNELEWFRSLPRDLADITPSVRSEDDGVTASYEVEYWPVVSCGEALTMCRLDDGYWAGVRRGIKTTLDRLHSSPIEAPGRERMSGANTDLVVSKLIRRLAEIRSNDRMMVLLRSDASLNGKRMGIVDNVLDDLVATVERFYEPEDWSRMHGDVVLGNILYDRRSSRVVLVDPRGRSGKFPLGGDKRYDYAKLSQSIFGLYDFLVSGLFDVCGSSTSAMLEIFHNDDSERVLARLAGWFDDWMQEENVDRDLIQLIEASLLVSAIPLHYESFARQKALLYRGLERFKALQ